MNKPLNPETIPAPIGVYSHAVESPAGARTIQVSGQVGIAADGSIPEDAGEQAKLIWQYLAEILKAADMGIEDITKMTAYMTDPADLPKYGPVRNAALGDHRPASTLVIVAALVKPELKVEVDIVAAKA